MMIGLDSLSVGLIDRWSSSGDLPNLARLSERAVVYPLASRGGLLPESVWREVITGCSIARWGQIFPASMLRTGETAPRRLEQEEVDPRTFWTHASDAGCRVAIVDLPFSVPAPGLNGVHLLEWGVHDRKFGPQSEPPALLKEVLRQHGEYRVWSCDDHHGSTLDGYERLLDDLLDGGRRKAGFLLDLLERERWDLYACAITEPHCAGHQFWHFLEPEEQVGAGSAVPARLRDALRTVYRQVDATLGSLLEAAGPEATVLVVAAKGMGPACGGQQLLPDVLARLGLDTAAGAPARLVTGAPARLKTVARRATPERVRLRLKASLGLESDPLGSPLTRAVSLPNELNFGAIRFNLKGRDPYGCVEAGPEAEALTEELRGELLALEDPTTGERIVSCVVTPFEVFGPAFHPDLPDLMIAFRTDLGVIEACRSDRIDLVRVPLERTWFHADRRQRTGDHTDEGRLWIARPGVSPSGEAPGADVLDIAPTVLTLLGVPLPSGLDGRSLPMTG